MPLAPRAVSRKRLLSTRLVVAVALAALVFATLGEQTFVRIVRPDTVRIIITEYQFVLYTPTPPVIAFDRAIHNEATATRVRDLLTQIPRSYRGDVACLTPADSYSYDFTLLWRGIPIETSNLTPVNCANWTVSLGGVPDLLPHSHTLPNYSTVLHGITDTVNLPYLYPY